MRWNELPLRAVESHHVGDMFVGGKTSSYLYKSYPAASAEPRVGNLAFSESRLIRRLDVGSTGDASVSDADILLFFTCGGSVMEDGRDETRRRSRKLNTVEERVNSASSGIQKSMPLGTGFTTRLPVWLSRLSAPSAIEHS